MVLCSIMKSVSGLGPGSQTINTEILRHDIQTDERIDVTDAHKHVHPDGSLWSNTGSAAGYVKQTDVSLSGSVGPRPDQQNETHLKYTPHFPYTATSASPVSMCIKTYGCGSRKHAHPPYIPIESATQNVYS